MEIERKFLVRSLDFKKSLFKKTYIVQGFLNTHPERTVRIRIKEKNAYITVKGKGNKSGTSRFEWERKIKVSDAQELLKLCESIVLEKYRYEVPIGTHTFEVDEFLGANEGLLIAEVELQDEHEIFERPSWLGQEVTGDVKYYNSMLSKKPFSKWKF